MGLFWPLKRVNVGMGGVDAFEAVSFYTQDATVELWICLL